jgi:hypothetical protein
VTDEFRRELSVHVPRNHRQTRTFEETIRRTFE